MEKNHPSAMRFAGAGIELAGVILAMAGLGYLLDTYFHFSRAYGVLTGTLLGFAVGMARLFRLAIKFNR